MEKLFRGTLVFILILSFSVIAQTTVNGQFVVVSSDSSQHTVKFQINTDTGTDTLGCSTIIFNFNSTSISFPETPVNNTDYNFLNFITSDYISTITRPLLNQIWINIESLYSNKGTVVAQSPEWTDVAQLNFKVLKDTGSFELTWQTSDNNWAIYNVDNSTIWPNGNWTDEITSTIVEAGDITPKEFILYQNYPNPFNPSTSIKFSVPYRSLVSIIVYDAIGREVTTLLSEDKSAGTYSIHFSADGLSSGMYLYRILGDNFMQVRKMVLLR